MKRNLRDRWVADLRANPDKQGWGYLWTEDNKNCCLGRLCLLMGAAPHAEQSYRGFDFVTTDGLKRSSTELPRAVADNIGLPHHIMTALITMNDGKVAPGVNSENRVGKKTFLEIADYIEANLSVEE